MFKDVSDETIEKCVEIPTTFALPKLDDAPIDYLILDEPFQIDTPNSKFDDTAFKMKVETNGVEGEIFVPKSLITNIAIGLAKLGMSYKKAKMKGLEMRVWMQSGNDGFSYYHCTLKRP